MSYLFRRSSRLHWLFISEYRIFYKPKWIMVMDDFGNLLPIHKVANHSLAEGYA